MIFTKFLFLFLFIIGILLLMGALMVGRLFFGILRLFSWGKKDGHDRERTQWTQTGGQYTWTSQDNNTKKNRQDKPQVIDQRDPQKAQQKIFPKDEGEYVDFKE